MPDRTDLPMRLETDGGIPYRLQPGYPTFDFAQDKVTATEVYIIPASRIGDFYFECMPGVRILMNGTTPTLVINGGRPLPGTTFITTKTITLRPWQGDAFPGDPFEVDRADLGNTAWQRTYAMYYEATITYETTPFGGDDDDATPNEQEPESFLEHSVSVGGQLIATQTAKVKIKEQTLSQNPGYPDLDPTYVVPEADRVENKDPLLPTTRLIPGIEHNLKWRYCLRPAWSVIRASLGVLNDRALPLFFNAPAETIMFTGLSGSQQYLWTGQFTRNSIRVRPWNMDFKFSERYIIEAGEEYGWNHVYSPLKGKWVRLVRPDGKGMYTVANLKDIFTSVSVTGF